MQDQVQVELAVGLLLMALASPAVARAQSHAPRRDAAESSLSQPAIRPAFDSRPQHSWLQHSWLQQGMAQRPGFSPTSSAALTSLASLASSQNEQKNGPKSRGETGAKQGNQEGADRRNPRPTPGEWLRKHKDLPADQQEKLMERDPNFQKLAPERQQKMREHLRQFNNMPPQQRQRWIERMQAIDKLSPQQRQTLQQSAAQLRSMPEDRRVAVRKAFRHLSQMPPQDRTKIMDSDRFKQSFSPGERSVMQELFGADIHSMPGEPNAPRGDAGESPRK